MTEQIVTFTETCTECNKSMIGDDGTRIGGVIGMVHVDDEIIFSTTCWKCAVAVKK